MPEWTEREIELLKALIQENPEARYEEIAEEIPGRSSEAVRKKIKRIAKNKEEDILDEPTNEKITSTILKDGGMLLESTSKRIKTLEDLIESCEIDLELWQVDRWIANAWETTTRDITKSLKFEDGKISGTVEHNPHGVQSTNYQVKAWLIPKKLPKIEHVIQPVHINLHSVKEQKREDFDESTLQITDAHFGFDRDLRTNKLTPYHHRQTLDIALQIVKQYKFKRIIFAGDWWDLPDWSDKYFRTPEMYWNTQAALDEAGWWLGQICSYSPESEKAYLEGNHDYRIPFAVAKHLSAAYKLRPALAENIEPVMSIPFLMGFENLGIRFIGGYENEESKFWDGDICYLHGNRVNKNSGGTAMNMLREKNYSTVMGHIHRIEIATKSVRVSENETKILFSFCPGCACHTDGRVPGSNPDANWQNGIGVIHKKDGITFLPIAVAVINGKAVFNGEVYTARSEENILQNIVKDTGSTLQNLL